MPRGLWPIECNGGYILKRLVELAIVDDVAGISLAKLKVQRVLNLENDRLVCLNLQCFAGLTFADGE